ncbi:MAG: hypothetical protein NVSMB14_03160 [Isosphaeraceae bacterium]
MLSRHAGRIRRRRDGRGFTLIELLVVIAIIVIVAATTLPMIFAASPRQQISEAARLVQAKLSAARDSAVRAGKPHGIRLLPDETFLAQTAAAQTPDNQNYRGILASSRIIDIEQAPDYTEGRLFGFYANNYYGPQVQPIGNGGSVLVVYESKHDSLGSLQSPVSWYWNIRVGERIRLNNSGRLYTIVGPDVVNNVLDLTGISNPERFVNNGPQALYKPNISAAPEYLLLVNGEDDNADGYVDNGFDGLDNNANGIIDESLEYENEQFVGPQFTPFSLTTANALPFPSVVPPGTTPPLINIPYTIYRRPVPTPGANDLALPSGVVIDLTTWNSPFLPSTPNNPAPPPQRSRLPVDPFTHYVDIMIAPNGEVVPTMPGQNALPYLNVPFYHFWIAQREDVYGPMYGVVPVGAIPMNYPPALNPNSPSTPYQLPMPAGTINYSGPKVLKGDRRLVTLNIKTGGITALRIETFNGADINLPYRQAQLGARD